MCGDKGIPSGMNAVSDIPKQDSNNQKSTAETVYIILSLKWTSVHDTERIRFYTAIAMLRNLNLL